MSLIASITGFQGLMMGLIFIVCVLLMLIILIQKGRGGGLAAAFGGGGGGGGAFGAKTGDVFTGITVVLAGVYLLLTVAGNFAFRAPAPTVPPAVQPAGGQGAAPAGADEGEAEVPAPAVTEEKVPTGTDLIDPNTTDTPAGAAPAEPPAADGAEAPAGEPEAGEDANM